MISASEVRLLLWAVALSATPALAQDTDPSRGGGRERPAPSSAPSYSGPDTVQIDLLRPSKGGPRILVQAVMADGQTGLFLVDTGAAVSALSEDTAERLGLSVQRDWGYVEGLGGRAAAHRASAPVRLGDALVPDVEFAVGVRGVPETFGAMPLDGILGNNVWSRFTVEIDYPADTMVLHRQGTFKMPKRSDPMFFDGGHILAPVTITTDADPPHQDQVLIQLDTGASGLLLAGRNGAHFEQDYTEGIEPIYGIGGHELMPASQFLQTTRRIPVAHVEVGGQTVDAVREARWVNFDGAAIGPNGLQGLAGHELISDYCVLLDYAGGRIALRKSKRKARQIDGHDVLLGQDIVRYGDDPNRYLFRARLGLFMDDIEAATGLLEAVLARADDTADAEDMAEARVLLASIRRLDGDLPGAWQALAPLAPGELVDQNEIVAAVNGLLLEDRDEEAQALALAGTEQRAEEAAAWVALSDVRFAQGLYDQADSALQTAAHLSQNPDANLLRRSRIALAQGDTYGAMADVRRLVDLYPFQGQFLWFYAELIDPQTDGSTFRHDMERAMARLHPRDRPLDFQVAARHALGDDEGAKALMREGLERDCSQVDGASEDNCVAWYYALASHDLDEALRRIDAALAEEGERSDFLDTRAMVHLARGEVREAHEAAVSAARLSPDDIYMLWQASRLAQMLQERG